MPRGLVIGIPSSTFGGDDFPDLPGVDYDVAQVKRLLRDRGFDLVAAEGTGTTAIDVANSLASYVDTSEPGDTNVIYFAGHGYRTEDTSGDEDDGWDESIVCSDMPIIDDWFRDDLWPRAPTGSMFVVIVDACHSNTSTLQLKADDSPPVAPPVTQARGFYRLSLAACRDEEVTKERVKWDRGAGIVTSELLDVLAKRPSASYRDVWSEVATYVRDRYAHTGVGTPQLDYQGPDDALLNAPAFKI